MPGIELPGHRIAALRDQTVAASGAFGEGPRILVYACEQCGVEGLADEGAQVLRMPCIGMLPPSFVDFVLSRRLADGVMLAGCADGDCYHRLGGEWTRLRLARERDPYLRERVDRSRVHYLRTRPCSQAQHSREFRGFRDQVAVLPEPTGGRRRGDG